MKLQTLNIENINQFDYLYLDLTYPQGHVNSGKPLDKICFIGQSGTGKTTILQIIKSMFYPEDIPKYKGFYGTFRDTGRFITALNTIYQDGNQISYQLADQNGTAEDALKFFEGLLARKNVALMNFPADFLHRDVNEQYSQVDTNLKKYDFMEISVEGIWHVIIDSIRKLREEELIIRQQISKIAEAGFTADEMIINMQPFLDKLKALEQDDSNPLKKLARECLDPILNYFSLQVATKSKVIEQFNEMGFIEIENLYGEIVPNGFLSTGTRQFLMSILPFYLLKPNNAIILFDEPERSLYPNIQKLLVPHYTKFAPNCQFIYATHSPIVASCFDPWEVVELQFDDDGFVKQKLYYSGEKHVENYKIHPKYLTYDLILKEVFDVKDTEGDERARKLTELIMLEAELKKFKASNDNTSEKFNQTMDKYKEIGDLLSWPVKFTNEENN